MKLQLDNSALSTLVCDRRFELTVLDGLHTLSDREAAFGDAYHKCLEHLDKGVEPVTVVNKVFADAPSVDKTRLLKTLVQFKLSHKFPPALVINGAPMIEYKFSFPYTTRTLANGENLFINLAGTMDRSYIDPDNDQLVILDYKTSVVATDYLIAKTKSEYEMAFQLPFYTYAAYHGIFPAEYKAYIDARRYRTELHIAFYNAALPFHKIVRPAFNEYYFNVIIPQVIENRINHIVNIITSKPASVAAAYTGFNIYGACRTCQFRPACQVAGTSREQELLSRYNRREYNPMNFR